MSDWSPRQERHLVVRRNTVDMYIYNGQSQHLVRRATGHQDRETSGGLKKHCGEIQKEREREIMTRVSIWLERATGHRDKRETSGG
jgi:hypothetical protein